MWLYRSLPLGSIKGGGDMKQHITFSQLKELSNKAIDRLDIWYHDECEHVCHEVETDLPRHPLPLLSIGQMIEFLDDANSVGYSDEAGFIYLESTKEWGVTTSATYYKTELCDALWEAVKEILEEA